MYYNGLILCFYCSHTLHNYYNPNPVMRVSSNNLIMLYMMVGTLCSSYSPLSIVHCLWCTSALYIYCTLHIIMQKI